MLSPNDFVQALVDEGLTRFTGVPCSFFQAAINRVLDDDRLSYTMVPNEGSALAFASGAALAGQPACVLIQNSGFGNLINPLTSLNLIYGIPVLIFMSGRAYGVADEPQHEIMGRAMDGILDAMDVRHADLPADPDAFKKALGEALAHMRSEKKPFVFLVRKGTLDEYTPEKKDAGRWPLTRLEAIRVITETLQGDEYVVATTGKPSRELFALSDRARNFYMQGSMGHAASIGLGVAMSRPAERVVVLDGDGAILMHLGILSTVGHYKPPNLLHVVLDNEAYETTGDQDTTSSTTDLVRTAIAAGYRFGEEAQDESQLRAKFKKLLSGEGPSFLRVRINRRPTPDIPRISEKWTSAEIAKNFALSLKNQL